MRNKKLILIILVTSILILLVSQAFPFSRPMHRYLNERIAQRVINSFSWNEYLINQLGFESGIDEKFERDSIKKEIWWWLGLGGDKEDEPEGWRLIFNIARNNNHFHNPLGGLWEYSGLNASILLPFPPYRLNYSGQSSILWAQNPNQDPGGRWSWHDARKYFYTALTGLDWSGYLIAPTHSDKNRYYANTFRALGQLMHLIQDASVPAHSRNEIHTLYHYEKWLEDIREKGKYENPPFATFNKFIANPISFDQSLLNLVPFSSSAPIPIANIVDTDKYGGSNPEITATLAIGLAEYANANFFGERTIFSKNFPYPRETSGFIEDCEIPDPRGEKPSVMRPYFIKTRDGESGASSERSEKGKIGYRLATVGLLYNSFITFLPGLDLLTTLGLTSVALDGGVYKDYAEKLLPRALGYSAGLLEYFFRGRLEITIKDISRTRVTLSARNTTSGGEEMPQGLILLVVKYRLSPGGEFNYLVASELNNIQSISRNPGTELIFDLSPDTIPENAIDVYLQVVYTGKLGREVGGVWNGEEYSGIAVGLKGINLGIEIILPSKGVYAQTENRDEGFKKVTLNAQNTSTTGEEMTDGSIELVVKYRLALKDPFQSYPVPTTWEYSYIVVPELNNTRSIPRVNPIKLEFDLSSTPIPIHATDIYLQVVYKGKLGQEEGAVAVGFKDISEPTPIDIYNDMDRKCINGSWYVAGSPEALALGNQFNFDAYPHHLRNIYLRFSSTNNPQGASSTDFNLHIPSLDAGDFFIREAFVLSDYRFNYGYRVTVANANPNDPYVTWFEPRVIPYTGIKNQTEYVVLEDPQECAIYNLAAPCGIYIRYYPIFNSYRGQEMWLGVAFPNASYPPGSSCP